MVAGAGLAAGAAGAAGVVEAAAGAAESAGLLAVVDDEVLEPERLSVL